MLDLGEGNTSAIFLQNLEVTHAGLNTGPLKSLGKSPLTAMGFGSGLFSLFRQDNTRWSEILSPLKSMGVLPLTSTGPGFYSSSVIRV